MKEIWKSLSFLGYDNYEVSNFGRVKSLNYNHTGKEKILQPGINRYGYLYVALCKFGKLKKYTLHQLVALAFIDNPDNKPTVDHIDRNKTNNNVNNLRWATMIEQVANSDNKGAENGRNALSKAILQYNKQGIFIKEYQSVREAERQNGIYHTNISSCCLGKLKSAGGYIWRYKNEEK